MRRPVAHLLGPRGTLIIAIDPPMSDSEEPYIIAGSDQHPLVLKRVDDFSTVEIANTSDDIVPFFFFVGSRHIGAVAHALLDQLTKHRQG